MIKISALVIVFNEEKKIARCIGSLKSVADEIIVVDSYSNDNTKAICLDAGVKFIEHNFDGHIQQKNFALTLASHDFVLSLDADEYLSEELIHSIEQVKNNSTHQAYSMNRVTSLRGKWIRSTDWYPDRKLRLWNKTAGKWGGYNPHDKVVLRKGVRVRHIRGSIMHGGYDDFNGLITKASQYARIFAEAHQFRKPASVFKICYKSIFTFFRNYILRLGFISGFDGLVISVTNSYYTFFKYALLKEFSRSLPVIKEDASDYLPDGISVVIPNYNGVKLFPRTIAPLFEALRSTSIPYEIFIVDDCSTDDSVNYLLQHHPEIKVLKNDANKGFSCTVNRGIFASKYDLVFLLNSDIILTDGYFHHQLKYFRNKDTFGVMGRIVGWNDENIQDGAKFPLAYGFKIKTSCNYLLDKMDEESLYSLYLSGANALVDRKKLVALGGFDEIFSPFYIEDCELSFRAWRLGWKCYYENRALCRHQTSFTIRATRRKNEVNVIYNRNKLYLHAIHLETFQFPFWFLHVLADAIARMLTLRVSLIKAIFLFMQQRNCWLASRKKFQALMSEQGEAISLHQVFRGIRESLHKRKKIKFLSKRGD